MALASGISVDVYDLHMDAGDSERDHLARANQVGQLLAAIAARSIGRAVIIAGDTNLRAGRAPSSGQAPSDEAILA